MVATVVLVVFERFAFAAENLSTMKQTIQIIAKQYRTVDNRRVHAKRDHDTLFKILPGMRQTAINIYTCAFQRGCSCLITHDYSIFSTCPF